MSDLMETIGQGKIGTAFWSINEHGVLTIGPGELDLSKTEDSLSFFWPWREYADQIQEIDGRACFGAKGSFNNAFARLSNLKKVDLSGWNTQEMTSAEFMFWQCEALETLDLSRWNMQRVESLCGCFKGCKGLKHLAISNWDTASLTNISGLFEECMALESLDLSRWNTSKVVSMGSVFEKCVALQTLDLSNWDTSQVDWMQAMFKDCGALYVLKMDRWDTSHVTNMSNLFKKCRKLTSIDVSHWNTSQVEDMHGLFKGCISLTSLNLSHWSFSQLKEEEVKDFVSECWELEEIFYMEGEKNLETMLWLLRQSYPLVFCEQKDKDLFSSFTPTELILISTDTHALQHLILIPIPARTPEGELIDVSISF